MGGGLAPGDGTEAVDREAVDRASAEPDARTRHFAVVLAIIGTAALVVRVGYVLLVTRHQALAIDEHYYRNGAIALAEGDGFRFSPLFGAPTYELANHPPLTSIALAPAARLMGGSELGMRLTVALAGVGVVIVVALLARAVAGERAGLVAAVLAALYPNLWVNDGVLMPETFAALGTALTVLFTYRLIREPTWWSAAAAGAASGIAMLSRSELALLVLLPVLAVTFTLGGVALRSRLRVGGIVVLAASLVVAPWVVYNLSRFERPVLLSYGDGATLLGANCDATYSGPLLGSWAGFCTFGEPDDELSDLNARKRTRALEYMRDHLGRLPVVAAARVGRTWSVFRPHQMADFAEGEGRPTWVSWLGWAVYWPLLALAVPGALVLRRRGVRLLPLVAPAVVVTLVSAGFYGLVRFRAPAEISIVVLAAIALDGSLEALRTRRSPWWAARWRSDFGLSGRIMG